MYMYVHVHVHVHLQRMLHTTTLCVVACTYIDACTLCNTHFTCTIMETAVHLAIYCAAYSGHVSDPPVRSVVRMSQLHVGYSTCTFLPAYHGTARG